MIDILAGINTAVDIAAKLKNMGKKKPAGEAEKLISEMNVELAKTKNNIADLLNENRQLKDELRELKNIEQSPLIFKKGAYYTDDGNGPFCPQCFDNNNKKIRLSKISMRKGNHYCPTCRNVYKLTQY
jgi:urease gamma subunit